MIEEITIEEIAWLMACALFFFTGWLTGKGYLFNFKLPIGIHEEVKKMETSDEKRMDKYCPWYLGRRKVSKDCDKTCPITNENRDMNVCPESYID